MSGEQAPNARDAIYGDPVFDAAVERILAEVQAFGNAELIEACVGVALEEATKAAEVLRVGWERDARQAERDRIRNQGAEIAAEVLDYWATRNGAFAVSSVKAQNRRSAREAWTEAFDQTVLARRGDE